jgi:hypothetical protein
MIEINDKNNYLEIINKLNINDVQTAYYSKKHSTFDVFYLEQPRTIDEGKPIEGESGETTDVKVGERIEGESGEPIDGESGESIDVAVPHPIRIGNIQIKRFGGSIVIDSNSFLNELVYIDGRLSDFEDCLNFLTRNTSV